MTYLFGADGAMQYGWYTDASGMRYFQTNGAMAVNTTLAVGGVTYVFDANGLATAVPGDQSCNMGNGSCDRCDD